MNILFLTMVNINTPDGKGIYTDLIRALIKEGNKVFTASPSERKYGKKTHLIKGDDWEILKIKTLNLTKTNTLEKGIGQLLLEFQFDKAINKYWKNIKFDLVIYSTPPITFNKVIEKIKKRDGAISYLMLKDIFPQNAIDLGMMKENSFLHDLFRKKEKKLYEISDYIGCMSPANMEFVLKYNKNIDQKKVVYFPNSIEINESHSISSEERVEALENLNIPSDKTLFIYGGNLGKPQGIDFLIQVLKENEKLSKSFILVVGSGTEYHKLNNWFDLNQPRNSRLLAGLPKEEYDKLVRVADVGLIFLDHRFTIPNYPSRLLSYLENSQPVLIASDPNTDIGKIAEENGYGYWCESNDVGSFMRNMEKLIENIDHRKEMGKRGRKFLEDEYDISKAVKSLLRNLNQY